MPSFTIALLIAGLKQPVAASIMGAGWLVSRVVYAIGYTDPKRDDGKGRLYGAPFWLFQLGLFGMTAWNGIQMLM